MSEDWNTHIAPKLLPHEYPRDMLEQTKMDLVYSLGYQDGLRKAQELLLKTAVAYRALQAADERP